MTRAVMGQQVDIGISRVLQSPSRISLTVTGLGKVSSGLCPQPLCPFCRAQLDSSHILNMRRHHHQLSKLLFLQLSMQRKKVLQVQQKHFKFTTTMQTTTKTPELTQILSCCSSRHISRFTCRNTNSLCSSTDNHLPLPPPRKASY